MRKLNIREMLMHVLYFVEASIIIAQVLNYEMLINVLFLFTFLIVFLLFITKNFTSIKAIDILFAIIIIGSLSNVLINAWMNDGIIALDYFKKVIMFDTTIIYLRIIYDYVPTMRLKRWIGIINTVVSCLLIYFYYNRRIDVFMFNG